MSTVTITVSNLEIESGSKLIPNWPIAILDELGTPITTISTSHSGSVSYSYTGIIKVQPVPLEGWATPRNKTTGSFSPEVIDSNVSSSTWEVSVPTVAPTKPIITASQNSIGQINVLHQNDIYRNETNSTLLFSAFNEFDFAVPVSEQPGGFTELEFTIDGYQKTRFIIEPPAISLDDPTFFWLVTDNDAGVSEVSEVVEGIALSFLGSTEKYNLTTEVNEAVDGGSITGHPSCPGENKRAGDPCTGEIIFERTVNLSATPDSGYVISGWDVSADVSFFVPIGNNNINQTVSFIYDIREDVIVSVSFVSVSCQVTFSTSTGGDTSNNDGCILLDSPNTPINCSGEGITLNPNSTPNIQVSAIPNSGYQIEDWFVDGVSQSSTNSFISVPITSFYERTVRVSFEEETPCEDPKTLTINIVGQGSVITPDATSCVGDILYLNHKASNGWRFVRWEYVASLDITLDGETLRVVMNTEKTITAHFEEIITDLENITLRDAEATIFYCSSETYRDNIVSFNFNREDNPSIGNMYHFRVNFYADVLKNSLVYSAFSLVDNKRWFSNDGFFNQLPSNGINVDLDETVEIIYDPEVLPQQITESQKPHLISDGVIYEKPLICGVKYYVEIQAYELSTNTIINVDTISLMLDCNKVDSYYWNYNKDKNNWLCSGQGKADLKVCGGFGQAINSSVTSNIFGVFQVVWQGRRVSGNNTYSAIWDSSTDILYSSGQGMYDVLELKGANRSIAITDPANNFYVTGSLSDKIEYKACSLEKCEELVPGDVTGGTGNFAAFCLPGSSNFLGSSYDEIKIRVYSEDVSGSLVVNDEKVISVIDKQSIRLDIDGIVGAYAVRLGNMEDRGWGEWINIDNKLSGVEAGDDEHHDAYRIDNNRFLVQWDVSRNNGLRRICCQVLTMYGISNSFCIDVLVNFDVVQHTFKFYVEDPILTNEIGLNEFPIYKGQYVVSIREATNKGATLNSDGSVTIYFQAIFSEPIYKDDTVDPPILYEDNEVRFNVIQQGINDIRDQGLISGSDGKKFTGQFNIYDNDDIFNKDGAAFIEVILPGTLAAESCGSDNTDTYNLVNTDAEEIANIDLLPEEVYRKYQSDQLSKTLDINKFKQDYDKDDTNYKFGNPGYYRS